MESIVDPGDPCVLRQNNDKILRVSESTLFRGITPGRQFIILTVTLRRSTDLIHVRVGYPCLVIPTY